MRHIATNGVFVIASLVLLATAGLILGGWSLIAPYKPAWAETPTETPIESVAEPLGAREPTTAEATSSTKSATPMGSMTSSATMTVRDASTSGSAPEPTPGRALIVGEVLGRGERPVAGAAIMLHSGLGRIVANSGPDGSFVFPDLEPGDYRVRAFRSGYAPFVPDGADSVVTIAADETRTLPIRLGPGQRLNGVVVSADGTGPVAGANVALARGEFDDRVRTKTRRDGTFTFANFPKMADDSRPYTLHVTRDGFAPTFAPLKPEDRFAPVEIQLRRGTRVHGRVIDANGGPIRSARIRCAFRYQHVRRVSHIESMTDAAGYYSVANVPTGMIVQVWAHKPGHRSTFINLIIGDDQNSKLVPPLKLLAK